MKYDYYKMIGNRYGRLVVVKRVEDFVSSQGQKIPKFLCRCDCGNEKEIRARNLIKGTRSCGCLKKEIWDENRTTNKFTATHGKRHTRLYNIWLGIKQKCFNPKSPEYKRYGGRGITVSEEWRNNFQSFWDWAYENGYKEEILPNGKNKWTIDRIDVNGNYEPSNCRWADMLTQSNNKRDNHLITYEGETLTLAQTAKKFNISQKVLGDRLRSGWGIEEAIKTPLNPTTHTARKSIEQDGRTKVNRVSRRKHHI